MSKQQAIGLSERDFFQRSALNYDDLLAALNRGGNSALTRSREGRVLLSSTHAITGAYEKPFRMLTQKDFDSSQPQRRASLGNRPAEPQGLRDPQDNALHLSPQLSSIADTGVRAFRRRARLLLPWASPASARRPLPDTFTVRPAGVIDRSFACQLRSIPESLFESEMFGYERGAFTGALQGGKQGMSVVTEGLREYEIPEERPSVLAITLLRSVGWLGKAGMPWRPGRASGMALPRRTRKLQVNSPPDSP